MSLIVVCNLNTKVYRDPGYAPRSSFQKGTRSPGSDPPALSYPPQTGVMAVYQINYDDNHVCLGVSTIIKMLHHRRFNSPPMHDVISVNVDPGV